MTLYVDPEAEAALLGLYRDPQSKALAEKVERAHDELEAHPGDRAARRRRFGKANLWAVVVVDGDEEWAILWEGPDDSGDVDVRYIGSASFLP